MRLREIVQRVIQKIRSFEPISLKQENKVIQKMADTRKSKLIASIQVYKDYENYRRQPKKVINEPESLPSVLASDNNSLTNQEAKNVVEQKKTTVPYGILYRDKECNDQERSWRIAGAAGCPSETYAYVRTELGFIRITSAPGGFTHHRALSDHASRVRYAGVIKFTSDGRLESWDNESGGYLPPAKLAAQAGLPMDNKFSSVESRKNAASSSAQPAPQQSPAEKAEVKITAQSTMAEEVKFTLPQSRSEPSSVARRAALFDPTGSGLFKASSHIVAKNSASNIGAEEVKLTLPQSRSEPYDCRAVSDFVRPKPFVTSNLTADSHCLPTLFERQKFTMACA